MLLRCGWHAEARREYIIAEYLRQTLCALATGPDGSRATEPVYVTRLINLVRSQLRPLWPDLHAASMAPTPSGEDTIQPDPVLHVLEMLHRVRDVANLGHGYWLPSPTRFVLLPSGPVLVVGGSGTEQLRARFDIHPRVSGISRVVQREKLPQATRRDPTLWQSWESWLGRWMGGALRDWTRGILEQARRTLAESGTKLADVDVYVPQQRPRDLQYFRWISIHDLAEPPPDLVLCRSRWQALGPRVYWFGTIKMVGDTPYLIEESAMERSMVPRLLYGLDLLAGAPTTATIATEGNDHILTLRNWLPPEEHRLLLALGRDESQRPGRLPMTFRVDADDSETVLEALADLGIRVTVRR